MKEYQTTDFFTIVSNNLQSYTEEAERIGQSLYTLYKDVQDRNFTITLRTSDIEITNIPNFYPTYIFKVMPCVGKDKEFCIDVNIQFRDAIHKFVMRWGNNKEV